MIDINENMPSDFKRASSERRLFPGFEDFSREAAESMGLELLDPRDPDFDEKMIKQIQRHLQNRRIGLSPDESDS